MPIQLENDGIRRMLDIGQEKDPTFNPVLQIIKIIPKKVGTKPRVILSDGTHWCNGCLAEEFNDMIEKEKLTDYTIIRATDYMNITNENPRLIYVLSLEIIDDKQNEKIGNPIRHTMNVNNNLHTAADGNGNGNGNGNHHVVPKTEYDTQQSPSAPVPSSSSSSGTVQSPNNPYSPRGSTSSGIVRGRTNAPIQRTGGGVAARHFTPIAALNPYNNRWTIKARIINKSDIRTWSNQRGEGQLFSVELLDASGMDIRATFFREAVDIFYNMLQCDIVYTFTGGKCKKANMQYNTCKSTNEITFDKNAEVKQVDDNGEITHQLYEFMHIADLDQIEPGKYVDIIGIVKYVSEPATIVSKKTAKELKKCDLTVVDDSGAEVSCTVWGERAMNALNEFANEPVVAFRRARVSDYGGRTLSASGGNGIISNPRVQEADRIRTWWHQGGNSFSGEVKKMTSSGGGARRFPEFDERKTVSAITSENMGQINPEKPDWISFKGTVSFIKSDRDGGAWYPACPNADEPCKNRYKVQQNADGMWYCDRCSKSYDHCKYRFIFSATLSDATATTWVSVFDDQAVVLLDGMAADELHRMVENGDGRDAYDLVFSKAQFTDWVFTCKVKQEAMNDGETRVKTTIQSLHKMDYVKEGRCLLNSILSMT